MPLHLLVLLVVIFKFLIGMTKESCEDHHIVSLAGSLDYPNILWLATECSVLLILWLPL